MPLKMTSFNAAHYADEDEIWSWINLNGVDESKYFIHNPKWIKPGVDFFACIFSSLCVITIFVLFFFSDIIKEKEESLVKAV